MNQIHNERLKLLATALNAMGVAHIVTGIVAPAATAIYGGAARSGFSAWWLLIFLVWLSVGAALHIATYCGTDRARETQVTDLQLYLLIAPLVTLVVIGGGGLWLSRYL